ncbi:MAG: helix-turn-helix domain-containing protein [Deltaproteobacteria bacterium]|nr:helix-turn-helix domain-containing protein [Deltaproteobacteria bacterium]
MVVTVEKSGRGVPDPEVSDKPVRRRFTAEYKLKIVRAADECELGTGDLGELLRREGLYSSNLLTWRRQRDEGGLAGLEPKKRGRKPTKRRDAVALEVERLKRENARLEQRLENAELIISVQKKLAKLLGIKLPKDDRNGGDE